MDLNSVKPLSVVDSPDGKGRGNTDKEDCTSKNTRGVMDTKQ